MATSQQADIATDYLVVGAGLSGLCFVDELVTHTSAQIVIVDRRDSPGGHWTETYPFVRLHQPASQYGVNSRELSNGREDVSTLNKGLSDLASGPEIQAYCLALMRDRFLPSGRVTFLPSTEYLPDGTLRREPSGKILTCDIKKKLVDAGYYTNVIPSNHKRSFTSENVTCVPPNSLPKLAKDFSNFTVLGAGKTGMDSCLWLLEEGVDPAHIRWILPADYWYYNRAMFQGTMDTFTSSLGAFIGMFESISSAKSARDVALGLERAGVWHRLDKSIEPMQFHAATLAPREVEELRRITNVARGGYVRAIEPSKILLTNATIEASPDTLYIDCTASCLPNRPNVPVFQPGKIVLQMIRQPLIPFSSAKIGYLESLPITDEERNEYATPMRYARNLDGYISTLQTDLENRAREQQNPQIMQWLAQSRLDTYTPLIAAVKPEEKEKAELVEKMKASFMAAYGHLPTVISSLKTEPVY